MIYQALLLSVIGTDQDHFPVVLAAADSTLEGMLSLNVNVVEEGAGASSSQYCARVMVGGAGMVHHDDMGRCVKSQASVRAYRQATAREVSVLSAYSARALERRPVAVPGRSR